jgi:hypothetical protein
VLKTGLDKLEDTRKGKNPVMILEGKLEGNRSVGRARVRDNEDIKMNLNEIA